MIAKTVTKEIFECKAQELLTVVADVSSYVHFIPFCSKVEVCDLCSNNRNEVFSALLYINLKFTTETFLTNVTVSKNTNSILISSNSDPFKKLVANWSFIDTDKFCKVTFSLNVTFNSFLKEKLFLLSFDKIALKIMDAFEKRAHKLKISNGIQ